MLDHPYCAKLLEVKVKQEQEELVDRIKEDTGVCNISNAIPTPYTVYKNSPDPIIASGSGSAVNIQESAKPSATKIYMDQTTSSENGIKSEYRNNGMKTDNGEMIMNFNNPPTPLTSSATTSRTSSPTIPRRMSMRKKKETHAWSTYKQGIVF